MAISNYQELRDAVLAYARRDDVGLLIDNFIQLAETEFYSNNVEILNMRFQEFTTNGTVTQGQNTFDLPTNYLEHRRVRLVIDGPGDRLYYRAPEQLKISDVAGQPCFFTVTDKIEFERFTDQDYDIELKYWGTIPALTSTADTNDILTNHPNIYLFGTLHQLFLYAEDDEKLEKYQAKFYEAIAGANEKDLAGRYGPAPRMTVEGSTP